MRAKSKKTKEDLSKTVAYIVMSMGARFLTKMIDKTLYQMTIRKKKAY